MCTRSHRYLHIWYKQRDVTSVSLIAQAHRTVLAGEVVCPRLAWGEGSQKWRDEQGLLTVGVTATGVGDAQVLGGEPATGHKGVSLENSGEVVKEPD